VGIRRAVAKSCLAPETTAAGCSGILADRHREAVNQVDSVLHRPGLPSQMILYAPF